MSTIQQINNTGYFTNFTKNATEIGGKVLTTAVRGTGSVVQTIVEKSPIGSVVAGLAIATLNAKMAHTEMHRTSDEYSYKRISTHFALAAVGTVFAVVGAVNLFQLAFPVSAPQVAVPVALPVSLPETVSEAAVTFSNVTTAAVDTPLVLGPVMPSVVFVEEAAAQVLGQVAEQAVAKAVEYNHSFCLLTDAPPKVFEVPTPIPISFTPPATEGVVQKIGSFFSRFIGR